MFIWYKRLMYIFIVPIMYLLEYKVYTKFIFVKIYFNRVGARSNINYYVRWICLLRKILERRRRREKKEHVVLFWVGAKDRPRVYLGGCVIELKGRVGSQFSWVYYLLLPFFGTSWSLPYDPPPLPLKFWSQ